MAATTDKAHFFSYAFQCACPMRCDVIAHFVHQDVNFLCTKLLVVFCFAAGAAWYINIVVSLRNIMILTTGT